MPRRSALRQSVEFYEPLDNPAQRPSAALEQSTAQTDRRQEAPSRQQRGMESIHMSVSRALGGPRPLCFNAGLHLLCQNGKEGAQVRALSASHRRLADYVIVGPAAGRRQASLARLQARARESESVAGVASQGCAARLARSGESSSFFCSDNQRGAAE